MAEIKSTLELALERTKKITLSEQEKKEIKEKEIVQKAAGLSRGYVEGRLQKNEILKEIAKMGTETGEMVRKSLLSRWIDALALNDDHERILGGIECLKERDIGAVKEKVRDLLFRYREQKEGIRRKITARMEESLKKKGIYGSAVEPNVEGSEKWKEQVQALDRSFAEETEAVREELRRL